MRSLPGCLPYRRDPSGRPRRCVRGQPAGISFSRAGRFFSTIVFLAGGIIGTFHHLYFSGTPEGVRV